MSTFAETQHPRAAAGTPDGGRFVTTAHAEADVALDTADLEVEGAVSDECRRILGILAPTGLRGRVVEDQPRGDGWTWFTVHNGEDELRIGARCTTAETGAAAEQAAVDSISVDLSNPMGEPDHAGACSSMYSRWIFDAEVQAAVRKTVLSAAMQEAAGRCWPELAGDALGPNYPLAVSAEPAPRPWRHAADPEPALRPGARLQAAGGEVLVEIDDDGDLAVWADGIALTNTPYLRTAVCGDVAARLRLDAEGGDPAQAVRQWLTGTYRCARDSAVYRRFFG